MNDYTSKYVESVFRNSNDSGELFDAFQTAVAEKIKDLELYKILLGNPVLSKDEVLMYSDKLCKELKDKEYDICMWTAKVLSTRMFEYGCRESSIAYFERAFYNNPENCEPLLKVLNLYETDMNIPINKKILNIIDLGLLSIKNKSRVYYSLSDIYKKIGKVEQSEYYFKLAEKFSKQEN
ncbi:MAG: hypothetical protein KJ571_04650 [Bacteroidetes bacterium]|nr:hypothetical protein [Bacteroidota bacterium]